MKSILIAGCVAALLSPVAASAQIQLTPNTLRLEDGAPRPEATLADAALLVGHWSGPFLGATAEELWMPPAGGAMAGIFRLYDADAVHFYETMILVEEEGSLSLDLKHFNADLSGWEEKDETVTFRLVRATAEGLWFEGLTFLLQPDGSLLGFVALGREEGGMEEASFVYRPLGPVAAVPAE